MFGIRFCEAVSVDHRSPRARTQRNQGWRYWRGVFRLNVSCLDGVRYVQTWPNASRLGDRYPRLLRALQWLCGRLTGHPFSRTERGYRGGRRADRWCRWCNHHDTIPMEECEFAGEMRDLMDVEEGQ